MRFPRFSHDVHGIFLGGRPHTASPMLGHYLSYDTSIMLGFYGAEHGWGILRAGGQELGAFASSHSHLGRVPEVGDAKDRKPEIRAARRVTAKVPGRGDPWLNSCLSPLTDTGPGLYLVRRGGRDTERRKNSREEEGNGINGSINRRRDRVSKINERPSVWPRSNR